MCAPEASARARLDGAGPGYRPKRERDHAPNPELPEIDVRDNPESRTGAASGSSPVARASDGGAPTRDAPPAGEEPQAVEGGTEAGSPVAGVQISEQDADAAVEPDDNAFEVEGPQAGHA